MNIDNVDDFANMDDFDKEAGNILSTHSVLYDTVSGRLVAEWNHRATSGGDAPPSLIEFASSYDGQKCVSWSRHSGGEHAADLKNSPGYVKITADSKEVIDSVWLDPQGSSMGFSSGFSSRLMDVESGAVCSLSSALSEWNKNKYPTSVQELPDGKWEIEAKVFFQDGSERAVKMRVLPHDGIVVYLSIVSPITNQEDLRLETEVVRDETQGAVPRKMYVVYPSSRRMVYITFSSVEKNIPLTKETFAPKLPEGCSVDDFVKKMSYKVGEPINKKEARREFARSYDTSIAKKIANSNTSGNAIVLRVVLVGLGTAMILFGLWRSIRRRRRAA